MNIFVLLFLDKAKAIGIPYTPVPKGPFQESSAKHASGTLSRKAFVPFAAHSIAIPLDRKGKASAKIHKFPLDYVGNMRKARPHQL